jgi:prepilin-type N-terminal cleavage/methylation domain-containing protein
MSARRTPRRGGFSLVELMISLTVGGIAITSIYAIGASATRTFHQQQQVASAQTALRNAMNQVKRDVARAGYLFTPMANAPSGYAPDACAPVSAPLDSGTTGWLAAFSRFTDNVTISSSNGNHAVDPTGNNAGNGFSVDELVMFGNYETGSEYPGVTLINDTTIAIDQDWQSFQRDFTDWPGGRAGTYMPAWFDQAFMPNRLIRIQTTRRRRHYAQIVSVTHPAATSTNDVLVQFTPAIPATCAAEVTGGWVAPISAIRYFVRDAPTAENERFAGTTGSFAQLIRSEVLPTDKVTAFADPDDNTYPRVVLDYVVGFNVAFTMNTATATGQPDSYVAGSLVGDLSDNIPAFSGNAQQMVYNNPERIRAVSIELAVRAPEQDPRMPFTSNCANMRCFQVFSDRPGAARVRRERADVFVPNVAFEGY